MSRAFHTLATQHAHRVLVQEHQDTRYTQRHYHDLPDRELHIGWDHQCRVQPRKFSVTIKISISILTQPKVKSFQHTSPNPRIHMSPPSPLNQCPPISEALPPPPPKGCPHTTRFDLFSPAHPNRRSGSPSLWPDPPNNPCLHCCLHRRLRVHLHTAVVHSETWICVLTRCKTTKSRLGRRER